MMSSNVVIRKAGGFYNVFDDDAIIVGYLTGYKVVNGRCGFPVNSLGKVTNILCDNKVDYSVRENMTDIETKKYKKNNKYDRILDKGKKKLNIDYRINGVLEKINELNYNKLCDLLDVIEEYINE